MKRLWMVLSICLIFSLPLLLVSTELPAAPSASQSLNTHPPDALADSLLRAFSASAQDALSYDGAVDFDVAQVAGADYLRAMQSDVTEDNAGNGTPDSPDDPDDGGWDEIVTSPPDPFSHTTAASAPGTYGRCALGLYSTYLEVGGVGYLVAMADAADQMTDNPNIDSGPDLIFLLLYQDLPGVGGTKYADSAQAKYDARIGVYTDATGLAEDIRDTYAAAGLENGIIAWDIGTWVRIAQMLNTRYPGNGYDSDADDIAEVIYQDSFRDNPGYFDIIGDAGWDPTYSDTNFYWYNLGITGLIDAFSSSAEHTEEISGLMSLLLDGQAGHGGMSFSYGAHPGDDDWRSTAAAMMTLGRLDQATYQNEINQMGYFLAATQDASGGWLEPSGDHSPAIAGDATAGLYYTTNDTAYDLSEVLVDDDFAGQPDVDLYNTANGTNHIWQYDAFAVVQDAISVVDGSTVTVLAGTYPDPVVIPAGIPLTLVGAGMTQTYLTGGMVLSNGSDGVTLEHLALSGEIDDLAVIRGGEPTNDLTLNHVLIDGEGATHSSRSSYAAGFTTGDVTITNCEFKNVAGQSVFDCSTHGAESVMGTVTFTDNYIHDCDGRVAFRGDDANRIDLVLAHSNTWENINDNWNPHPTVPNADACFLAYGVDVLQFHDNQMTNVEMSQLGDGQGLQTWRVDSIDVHDNDFTDCWQGIWLPGMGTEPAPAGGVYHNDFISTQDLAVFTTHSGGGYTSGILNAEANWWNTIKHSEIVGLTAGEVDFDPWCYDETHGNCALTYPPNEVWVDDDWAGSSDGDIVEGHIFGYDAFATITDGIMGSGSTVNVAEGTYDEQVIIDKPLTVRGAGDLSVIQPTAETIESVEVFEFDETGLAPVVVAEGVTPVIIEDFKIDGSQATDVPEGADRYVGLFLSGASATVRSVTVCNFTDQLDPVDGICICCVGGESATLVEIDNCDIFGVGRYGIVGIGDNLSVNVHDCDVTGPGVRHAGDVIADGITINSLATGTIVNNTVTGFAYDGAGGAARGIDGSGAFSVTDNIVTDCQHGIGAWGDGVDAPSLTIARNTISTTGLSGAEGDGVGGIVADVSSGGVATVTINNNDFSTGGVGSAIMIGTETDGSDAIDATILRNTVADWPTGVFLGGSSDEVIVSENHISNNVSGGTGVYIAATTTVSGLNIRGNEFVSNDTYAIDNAATQTINASGNWWGDASGPSSAKASSMAELSDRTGPAGALSPARIQPASGTGDPVNGSVDYTPWLNDGSDSQSGIPGFQADFSVLHIDDNSPQFGAETRLAEGINFSGSDTVLMAPGTYAEGPQVQVSLDITVIGDDRTTVTIVPTTNTGSSGDSRGWFLVDDGVSFNLSRVTLDGAGFLIYQGIRTLGSGTYDEIDFRNLTYQPSGAPYQGAGIAAFGTGDINITNCTFAGLGRVGAVLRNPSIAHSTFIENTYTGKGDGDWLDYGLEISAGAVVDVYDNDIGNCSGEGAGSGQTSAGVVVNTVYGAGTLTTLEGNVIHDCTAGLEIGFADTDASTVTVTDGNLFRYNGVGIVTAESPDIALTVYGNAFSNTVNAEDNTAGGAWDDGVSIGNCWADFSGNSGYPDQYDIPGTSGAIDLYPSVDCNLDMTPDHISYSCSGNLVFEVLLGGVVSGLEAANLTLSYPASMNLDQVTSSSGNVTVLKTTFDNATGLDSVRVAVGVLSGALEGPATLFTVELNGSEDMCSGGQVEMVHADLRDETNIPHSIPAPLAEPVSLALDCTDPSVAGITPSNGYYKSEPVVSVSAIDNCGLDAIYYQIDGCGAGGWNLLADGLSGTSFGPSDWTVPAAEWNALSEGVHCIHFKARDDNGRGNPDSCSLSWCFTKDLTPPPPPTDLVASPGHNKVRLSWTNAPSDFGHTVVMRSDWNAGGIGYPEYDDTDAEGIYPSDTSSFDFIYSGTDELHTDVFDLSNATRDVYHYAAFTVDQAGNVSAPSAGARSTSYWLGDIAGPGGLGTYDGSVYFEDLVVISTSFGKSHGFAAYVPECDIGPTVDFSPTGIPTTDNVVDFEDMSIFAINFDMVGPALKLVPLDPGSWQTPSGNDPGLALIESSHTPGRSNDHIVSVMLENNLDVVKSIHFVVSYDSETTELISVGQSDNLRSSELPVFFDAEDKDGIVDVTIAVLGGPATFGGSGEVASLTFRSAAGASTVVDFEEADLRDNQNNKLNPIVRHAERNEQDNVPRRYHLAQNYPNPFNAMTEIRYELAEPGELSLRIYNGLGQLVQTLFEGYRETGVYSVTWDTQGTAQNTTPSGVYYCRMTIDDYDVTRKLLLLK